MVRVMDYLQTGLPNGLSNGLSKLYIQWSMQWYPNCISNGLSKLSNGLSNGLSNLVQYKQQQLVRMINEITINSSNTIDLSRGDLLSWINQLLRTNVSKIEQLGTGAIYCQLIDALYPGKYPMPKVNWKAKFDYEYVANFKILQQSFTKLNIHKHIEVQKLIKCKYQDNLEFLQWFKKIFDSSGNPEATQSRKPDHDADKRREKENRAHRSTSFRDVPRSGSRTHTESHDHSIGAASESFMASERTDEHDRILKESNYRQTPSIMGTPAHSPLDPDWKQDLQRDAFQEEREFYLKKFKQIEHLCQDWKQERTSPELISQLRKIILVAADVEWRIEDGEYTESGPSKEETCKRGAQLQD